MNDSTPLLGQVVDHIPPTDSDLFLRVVESPWSFLSSRHLFFVRLFLAFSMTLFLSVYLVFEVLAGRGKIVAFRLMDLAWIGQCIYLWLTSYWMYLYTISKDQSRLPYAHTGCRYSPYSADMPLTFQEVLNGHLFRITSFPSGESGSNRFFFHTFYTIVMVLPLASTLLYFVLILPSDHPVVRLELILNSFGSAVALAELFLLNSAFETLSAWDQKRMTIESLLLSFFTVFYCYFWTKVGNQVIHGPNKDMDWRFFGDRRRYSDWLFAVIAVNVVGGVHTVWWILGFIKGRILKWAMSIDALEALFAPQVSPVCSSPREPV
ncbi:hypothetical protein P167DRAFT_486023 [Morchella conica CCBAS932]|uniref:Uncharacterized protein n=1 Tax=Morchella conica CCBAS932 TaxID=1392247 RepID=A0A3N4KW61_9PEZI|nr:hypothetical protein P167DRAFT_486023 [Morchella conica CCBAS932]